MFPWKRLKLVLLQNFDTILKNSKNEVLSFGVFTDLGQQADGLHAQGTLDRVLCFSKGSKVR